MYYTRWRNLIGKLELTKIMVISLLNYRNLSAES